MLSLPNMLLIGSADRNVGKTSFACNLIRRHSDSQQPAVCLPWHSLMLAGAKVDSPQSVYQAPIVAVKITVIKEKDGKCPRGGQGCGVCTSLRGKFLITEELNPNLAKDTSKMLVAGAKKTFWLRVLESHIEGGIESLLSVIRDAVECDPIIICESNSIRKVVEPGLFVILRRRGDDYVKPSCAEILHFADRIVYFDLPDKYSVDLSQFYFSDSRWFFKENATAIVLAGGKGSRIGGDKGLLPVKGKAMIEYIVEQLVPNFDEILISSNDVLKHSLAKYTVIPDEKAGEGPLMGILSCLEHSKSGLNFITACDIPDINMQLVRRMLREIGEYDVIVPIGNDGHIEPLFGIYKSSVNNIVREILYNSENRKVRSLFDRVKTKYLQFDTLDWYKNINTKSDYYNYLAWSKA